MLDVLGIAFGAGSRLVQGYMDNKAKEKEMSHEVVMFEKQIVLNSQKIAAEADLRKMEIGSTANLAEIDMLTTSIKAQSEEAQKAGGVAAFLSASLRPVTTYFLLTLYAVSKAAAFVMTSDGPTMDLAKAMNEVYTDFDSALLGSVVSFWFADRSISKANKK